MALHFNRFSVSRSRRDENYKYLDRTAVVVAIRAPAVHGVSSINRMPVLKLPINISDFSGRFYSTKFSPREQDMKGCTLSDSVF